MCEVVPSEWAHRLAEAVADAVREFAPTLGGLPVVLLAVGCYPWHGSVELSVLTADEVVADPELADATEMAAWRHYCFSDRLAAWRPVAALGAAMRAAYEAATNPPAVAEEFMRACARAAVSPQVAAAAARLERAAGFRFSVTHPDDGREFVAGSAPDAEPGAAVGCGGV